jgi:hypothetical protein
MDADGITRPAVAHEPAPTIVDSRFRGNDVWGGPRRCRAVNEGEEPRIICTCLRGRGHTESVWMVARKEAALPQKKLAGGAETPDCTSVGGLPSWGWVWHLLSNGLDQASSCARCRTLVPQGAATFRESD